MLLPDKPEVMSFVLTAGRYLRRGRRRELLPFVGRD
jgi:hypothetical protein